MVKLNSLVILASNASFYLSPARKERKCSNLKKLALRTGRTTDSCQAHPASHRDGTDDLRSDGRQSEGLNLIY